MLINPYFFLRLLTRKIRDLITKELQPIVYQYIDCSYKKKRKKLMHPKLSVKFLI
jgi:predicted metal-dependent peptidase